MGICNRDIDIDFINSVIHFSRIASVKIDNK